MVMPRGLNALLWLKEQRVPIPGRPDNANAIPKLKVIHCKLYQAGAVSFCFDQGPGLI